MKRFIVDRIEENKAVLECENGETAVLELSALPKDIKEGDILNFEGGSCCLDAEETRRRNEKLRTMMERLLDD